MVVRAKAKQILAGIEDSPCARWPLGRISKLLGLPVKVLETGIAHCPAEPLCHDSKG